MIKSFKIILSVLAAWTFLMGTASAQVPEVDLNQSPSGDKQGPTGFFKLIQCDGPEQAGRINPATGQVDLRKVNGQFVYPVKQGYVPCNFRGLMIQAQFLINAMIVVGVFAIMIGMAFAGGLYVTGKKSNIDWAKSIFPKLFWGFILMLTAWFIVYQILSWLTGSTGYLAP